MLVQNGFSIVVIIGTVIMSCIQLTQKRDVAVLMTSRFFIIAIDKMLAFAIIS